MPKLRLPTKLTKKPKNPDIITGTDSDKSSTASSTHPHHIQPLSRPSYKLLVPIVVLVAGIGIYSLLFSKAATNCLNTTTAIQSAVAASSSSGTTICVASGTYGSVSLSGTHATDVTISPDPALDPNSTGKVTMNGTITVSDNSSHIAIKNFYINGGINIKAGSSFITAANNDIDPSGMGVTLGSVNCEAKNVPYYPGCTTAPVVSNVKIIGNRIHYTNPSKDCPVDYASSSGEQDAIRINNYDQLEISYNEITRVIQPKDCTPANPDLSHSDCLQSVWSGKNITFDHNYLHDNNCQSFFLKDGDVATATVTNNLILRNRVNNLDESSIQVFDTTNLTIRNNTDWSGQGSILRQDPGTYNATVDHNVFTQFNNGCCNEPVYQLTENNNIFGNSPFTFTKSSTSTINANPGFKCAPNCGNGTLAGDDYRLSSNPNNIGIDWTPSQFTYGPVQDVATTNPTANVFVASNGSDTGSNCKLFSQAVTTPDPTGATLCKSFNIAWGKAAAGNTILVKAGTYGPQLVSGDKTAETKIIGEDGTKVAGGMECKAVFGGYGAFCANAKYMTLENVTIDSLNNTGKSSGSMINASNVTYRNVNLYGDYVNLNIDNGDYFTWQGGSHGQDGIDGAPRGCDVSQGEPVWVFSSNVTLDGIKFNPKKIKVGAGPYCGTDNTPHIETIRTESGGTNLTVKNSRFVAGSDAGSGHIFTSTGAQGLKLINNVFEPVNGSYSIQASSSPCDAWDFEYNTFMQGMSLNCGSNSTWVGNLGYESPGCVGSHTKNVWKGLTAGTACTNGTDKIVTDLGITSDGHLLSTSLAKDAGPATCPTQPTDIDGDTRPNGVACDAGADEYIGTTGGGDTQPPTTTISTTTPSNLITQSPVPTTTTPTVSFTFTGSDNSTAVASLTYECSLDSTTTYSACTSPKAYGTPTALNTGTHTFRVRSKDTAGNVDQTPATITWTITSSTSTCPTKAGDVNGDGSVNITDISALLSAYGQTTTTNCADLDKSGTVNIQDLSIILSKYGT